MISVSIPLAPYQVNMFKFFTALTHANSAINPFLYAFTNDAFKSAFADAFRCVAFSGQSQHQNHRRDARKRNADARAECAGDDADAQPLDLDQAGCRGQRLRPCPAAAIRDLDYAGCRGQRPPPGRLPRSETLTTLAVAVRDLDRACCRGQKPPPGRLPWSETWARLAAAVRELDQACCRGQSSAIHLKTMATTTSIAGGQTQMMRQVHDRLPRATADVNNDCGTTKMCVVVHLEQHQQ